MSHKNSRTSSPSSPPQHAPSKLPRFLQKSSARDRSKSVTDPTPTSPPGSPSSSPSPEVQSTPNPGKTPRKGSKFLGLNKEKRMSEASADGSVEMEEPPVIVEPVSIPRPRTRADRPANSAPDSIYASASSSGRIGDLPTRLSGWFTHTFSSSTTDLSLPTLLAQHASPKSKTGGSALLTAAKHGKGHLDKAVRYLLDSDATPDKCTDPIWLLGVQHPGYEPPLATALPETNRNSSPPTSFRRGSGSPASFRSSTSSIGSLSNSATEQNLLSQSTGPTPNSKHNPAANWPPVFYIDFTSRVWLTYRSHFPVPIKDGRLADLCGSGAESAASPVTTKSSPWHWVGREKSWNSDSGWGCMLRTGQSLLANALIHVHLGRDWRKPPYPVQTADYATYVHILTWFLDTPDPEAPFSVHRMALAGKEFGTDVGQWFGPSVAAGAIRTLVNAHPDAGLGVAVAVDGVLYQTDVLAASHGDHLGRTPRRHKRAWGDRPVLVLLGIRLGIEGVNPIYYETIKTIYTFPQSVGIAGGRPSSSYYFVGSQADSLFYLDPHHARPAIPLRPPPPGPSPLHRQQESEKEALGQSKAKRPSPKSPKQSHHHRLPTSPASSNRSSTFSYHAPASPSPLQQQYSTSSTSTTDTNDSAEANPRSQGQGSPYGPSRSPPPAPSSSYNHGHHGRWRSASQPASPGVSDMDHREFGLGDLSSSTGLDAVQLHYCNAYTAAELKTFHCERVRKMPLSGLDPSMLLGFLCKDEADWADFRKRVSELPRTIFSIQDEPPNWPSDSEDDMGLLSISEPDEPDDDEDIAEKVSVLDDEDEEGEDDDEEGSERFFDTRSASASSPSLSSGSVSAGGSYHKSRRQNTYTESDDQGRSTSSKTHSEDNDTEEDPVDPVTPGPGSRFAMIDLERVKKAAAADEARLREKRGESGITFSDDEEGEDLDKSITQSRVNAGAGKGGGAPGEFGEDDGDDIEDDWVEPSLPTPMPPPHQLQYAYQPMAAGPLASASSTSSQDLSAMPGALPKQESSKKSSSKGSSSGGVRKKKSGKKQVPVPVPTVKKSSSSRHHQQPQQQEHYPFPVTPATGGEDDDDDGGGESWTDEYGNASLSDDRQRTTSVVRKQPRMHTARARDGGRTQSGGVKAILADDPS